MKPLLSALQRLYEAAGHKAGGSLFTKSQRDALDEFIQRTHAIRCITAGRGVTYQVTHLPVVEHHLGTLSPAYFEEICSSLPNRAVNIANERSSKSGQHRHSAYYLIMRANGEHIQWQSNDKQLNVSEQTEQYGVAAVEVSLKDFWQTKQHLWLIENQALFDNLNWLPQGTHASIHWYRGQLSNVLLDWLAEKQRAPEVVLFPDYDGVGLNNFARLHQRLGDRCSLWFMQDWEAKLAKYGSNEIWKDTLKDFNAAGQYLNKALTPDKTNHKQILHLMSALKTHGLALEQEAIWLK